MAAQDHKTVDSIALDSDALRANLLETATGEVTIDSSLLVLEEVVANYKGISKNLHELLYEVCHPYRNWKMLVPRVRAFVLKNISHYFRHEKGPETFDRFMVIFFQALIDSRKKPKCPIASTWRRRPRKSTCPHGRSAGFWLAPSRSRWRGIAL